MPSIEKPTSIVVIESPWAPNLITGTSMETHLQYARACMCDCFRRGEAPFASHLLYPQMFDDSKPDERSAGIQGGFIWRFKAQALTAVYWDLGISAGMVKGIEHGLLFKLPVVFRLLGDGWDA